MPQATRIGDSTSGICDVNDDCCPHGRTGTNDEGSPNVFINGNKKAHRLGDGGSISCPHGGYFVSVAASKTVFANGLPLTRVGDGTVCTACGCGGQHSSGSQNVFIGD